MLKSIRAVLKWSICLLVASNSYALDVNALATCLTDNGWVMYESSVCEACYKQRQSFGKAMQHIDTVNCHQSASDQEIEMCIANDIAYTPTWVLIKNGAVVRRLVGYQSLEKLAQVSGCAQ